MGLQIKRRYIDFRRDLRIRLNLWTRRSTGESPLLTGERVVVSFTSYPPRYSSLHSVAQSLLKQTVLPTCVVLYIAESQAETLPVEVMRMQDERFKVRFVEDLRSYKKLLPALTDFPESIVITADDDVIYPADFVESLLKQSRANPRAVVCTRAHRITLDSDGSLRPYSEWEFDVQDPRSLEPSKDIMPTGVGGVLYPPGSLLPRVRDVAEALRLCPRGDDLWFFWMARLAGTLIVKTPTPFTLLFPTGSQDTALWHDNLTGGGNDPQIQALQAAHPLPLE